MSEQPSSPDIFGLDKKEVDRHPGLTDWKNEQKQKQEELKKSLQIREKIRAEYIRTMRESIQGEQFAGKEALQILPDKNDVSVIYIKTSQSTMQVDLHYDESYEAIDSLRKNKLTYPTYVSLTGTIGGEFYTIEELSVRESAILGGEILKHIERKKNPKIFGYTNITYSVSRLENMEGIITKEINLVGKKENGKIEKISFFENLNKEQKEMIYSYITHYFGAQIPDNFFQKNESIPKPRSRNISTEA